MQYTVSMIGESLHWVSPMEAIGRYNAGIMEMPAPNVVLLSELTNAFPTFDDVVKGLNVNSTPIDVLPEMVRHKTNQHEKVATVLLPGDRSHSATTPEDRERSFLRRFTYVKDDPFGVRAVFEERPTDDQDDLSTPMIPETCAVLIEQSQIDHLYSSVEVIPRLGEESQLQEKTLYEPMQFQMKDTALDEDGFLKVRAEDRADPFKPKFVKDQEARERTRDQQLARRAELMDRIRSRPARDAPPQLESGSSSDGTAADVPQLEAAAALTPDATESAHEGTKAS
jgi:hypothetical protein